VVDAVDFAELLGVDVWISSSGRSRS